MAWLELKNIHKKFGATEVLKEIDLEIDKGSFVVFVGPSGCGKTTLLRLIAGLESLCDGDIILDGKSIGLTPPAKRGMAMVFQSYALYPHMTVRENMAFGLKHTTSLSKSEINLKVEEVAATLQIDQLLSRKPKELSGGQRQRVAIGRAIVRDPKVFLFDEPLSNLDAALRMQMRMELANLKSKLATTMIYVTHDQVEAMTLADKIVVLNEGRIEQIGSPLELYHSPNNLFVAGFIGSPAMNFLPIARENGISISPLGPLNLNINESASVIGFRPNDVLSINKGGDFKVVLVEHLGAESYIHGVNGEHKLIAQMSPDAGLNVGDKVTIVPNLARVHLFNEHGKRMEV